MRNNRRFHGIVWAPGWGQPGHVGREGLRLNFDWLSEDKLSGSWSAGRAWSERVGGLHIYEKVGVVMVNDYAIARVQVKDSFEIG